MFTPNSEAQGIFAKISNLNGDISEYNDFLQVSHKIYNVFVHNKIDDPFILKWLDNLDEVRVRVRVRIKKLKLKRAELQTRLSQIELDEELDKLEEPKNA